MTVVPTPPELKHFTGSITLPAALTFPQYCAMDEALAESAQTKNIHRRQLALLPGLLAVVVEWNIENLPKPLTVENFPPKPARQRLRLVNWVFNQVMVLMRDEEAVPNA